MCSGKRKEQVERTPCDPNNAKNQSQRAPEPVWGLTACELPGLFLDAAQPGKDARHWRLVLSSACNLPIQTASNLVRTAGFTTSLILVEGGMPSTKVITISESSCGVSIKCLHISSDLDCASKRWYFKHLWYTLSLCRGDRHSPTPCFMHFVQ